jgi:hypothetical protein
MLAVDARLTVVGEASRRHDDQIARMKDAGARDPELR